MAAHGRVKRERNLVAGLGRVCRDPIDDDGFIENVVRYMRIYVLLYLRYTNRANVNAEHDESNSLNFISFDLCRCRRRRNIFITFLPTKPLSCSARSLPD